MATEHSIRQYRNWYAKLLRLYPRPYRERFGEGMEQTFNDLCRERVKAESGLFGCVLWMFVETSAGILRENATSMMRWSMKRGSTMFLKLVISLVAIAAIAVCIFPLPRLVTQEAAKTPETAYVVYLFLVGAYILAITFLVGLYQAFKLLNYVDEDKAFSELSARALRRLKYCAIAIGAMMVAGIATLMVLARGKGEDLAGIVAPALLITIVSSVVAIIAAVFQKRVQKALDIKSENDRVRL